VLECAFQVHIDVLVDLLILIRYVYIEHVHFVVAEVEEMFIFPDSSYPFMGVHTPCFLLAAVAIALAAI
jgi:hypothetical protein